MAIIAVCIVAAQVILGAVAVIVLTEQLAIFDVPFVAVPASSTS